MNVQRCYCSLLRRLAQASWETGSLPDSSLRVCSFRRIQKRIFDPRFARFCGRKERESEIGFVTLVTFRQRVQYARQPLKK